MKKFLSTTTIVLELLLLAGHDARAEEAAASPAAEAPAPKSQPSGDSKPEHERNFYNVLEDVLGDFEYDLKNGNTSGISNIALRYIAMSENIPPSFKNHLELLITESILKISKARIVQCLQCRAKKTSLSKDQVIISSPDSNPAEMARIAKSAGIEHFMDVAFTYQSSGIVLSLTVSDPETGSIIWSRNYNSETSRAAAFRRGVDYSQTDDAHKFTEYQPQVQNRLILYYMMEPNTSGSTSTLGLGLRMVERYDNRKKEVGFELDYFRDEIIPTHAPDPNTIDLYSGLNFTVLFLHSWNLLGGEENFNSIRNCITLGIGGSYSSGFMGSLFRGQYEWRLGKHYTFSLTAGYRPKATAFLNSNPAGEVTGVEGGLGINILF